jgi:hypothetical protein
MVMAVAVMGMASVVAGAVAMSLLFVIVCHRQSPPPKIKARGPICPAVQGSRGKLMGRPYSAAGAYALL